MTCCCRVDDTTLTAVLPLELDLLVLGYSDGHIRQASCLALASRCREPCSSSVSLSRPGDLTHLFHATFEYSLSSAIQSLYLIRDEQTGHAFVVSGSDDGGVAIWSLSNLELCARFIHFTVPLSHVAHVRAQDENVGSLRGCALFVSGDGTIVVVALDGFQFLYLIPGSASPLSYVYYGGGVDHEQVMVIYADGSGRVWDVKAREFRRAVNREKAKESLTRSPWHEIAISNLELQHAMSATTVSDDLIASQRASCLLSLALQRFVRFCATDLKAANHVPTYVPMRSLQSTPLPQLRALLSILLTPSLNPEIDDVCTTKLGLSIPSAGLDRSRGQTVCPRLVAKDPWCISGVASASRAMAILAVLKTMSANEALYDHCQTVIKFYATSLGMVVGREYQPPDLIWLARRWFDTINDVHQAAKTLVDAAVVRLSDERGLALVQDWLRYLPSSVEESSENPALALFLCGHVAVEKHAHLSSSTLGSIAGSISASLQDEDWTLRMVGVDLCARGFPIWEQHVDALAMLRALFNLAASSRKDNISIHNVGQQARQAVLQIASTSTTLFMATLTFDILNPDSVEHRKVLMQLLALLIRKRPLLLYTSLPRLMEAVVKSLDPNSTTSRDAVLDAATEIIGQVVKTFPTVDFHMATQRLTVGTCEGAFVMYDLKTATQLYVLEGHKKRPTACTFSPDGRRLVTVSLEEGTVLVWKVGSSFTSFFHPGAPPRQGSSGSQPYKTLNFNVGDGANMTLTDIQKMVKFEWPSDRSVRLHIRESTFTFST